ncbi:MAG TPA: exopolysaccharide biosynthesis polyprenyl glycosylphosphotransferase [Myxococcales bacterium]|nr:exopolysaccharide biosynthesis polyprenyl glycosylphosphotransferase [Myxococcales bacterium]
MRQFAGHWYSGRAARLCAVEGALVGLSLWVTGRHAAGNLRGLAALIGAAACVPAALYLADLYDPQVMRNDRARGSGTLKALGFAALFAAIIGVLGGGGLPKGALIGTFGVASLGVLLARAALVTRTDEDAHSRVLILGAGARAAEIARLIRTQAFGEYQVAGTLDPKLDLGAASNDGDEVLRAVAGVEPAPPLPLVTVAAEPQPAEVALAPVPAVVPGTQLIVAAPSASVEASVAALPAQPRAGGVEVGPLAPVVQLPSAPAQTLQIAAGSLPEAVKQLRADTVVIATDDAQEPLPVDELIRVRLHGVTVLPAQRFAERVLRRVPLSLLRPTDLAVGNALTSPMSQAGKRIFDLLMSSLLLICAAPLLAVLAVLIKLDSEGPVFYLQERTGRGGKPYGVHKLRTMHNDAETLSGPVWASQRDPRVTRLGAFLRKTRLDEVPQVFAVFRGNMSFVGPRPERPFFVNQLKQQIPFFGLREAVKPGITGWAQIRYPYGSTIEDAKNKLEYDLYYVEHRSLFLDLAICFHTAKIVLFGRGAR